MAAAYEQIVSNYIDRGYTVHDHRTESTVLLRLGKPCSAVVVFENGQPTRVLNGMQIDKLLQGEDIMATKAKKTPAKKTPAKKTPVSLGKRNGSVAKARTIFDGLQEKTRKAALVACDKAGINRNTASTQWQKYRQENGL